LAIVGHPNRPADGVQGRSGPLPDDALRRLSRRIRDCLNKIIEINWLDGYAAILTWLEVVSMVRAAFEGGGAPFPSTRHRFGSPQHG
jgi:hypothetical protein